MEREEFKTIVKGLKAVYAQPAFIPDADAFDVWYGMLRDLPYRQASLAVQQHMASSPYPPTISDIRRLCAGETEVLSMDDAWGMVLKAIRTYGYMRESQALNSLPEPCRSVVRNMGWQNLCQSENIMAERAFFRDSYKPKLERIRQGEVIPAGIKECGGRLGQRIGEAANGLTLGGDKDGDTGAGGCDTVKIQG